MLPYFRQLGIRVEKEWLLQSYDESRFSELASRILKENPPGEVVTVAEIVNWIFRPLHAVPQPPWNPAAIGQPSIVVFSSTRFMIEVLVWLDATTSIHQHAFSGAFTILEGSSVHSQWTFTERQRISGGFRTGELALTGVEVLHVGDVRTIEAGDTFIHQLFHLDMPSVTIVVRTRREEEHSPQFVYFLPGLALDPQTDDVLLPRRLALLDGMLRAPMGDVVKAAAELLVEGDLRTVYKVLQHLARRNLDRARFEVLCRIARERHGDIVQVFLEAIDVARREGEVIARRQRFVQPRHRFLLALLLLVPDRTIIDSLLAAEYPDEAPESFIVTAVQEMSGLDTIGIVFDEVNTLLFRCLLDGLDEASTLERVAAVYSAADVQQQRDLVLAQRERIADSELFAPLFRNRRPAAADPVPDVLATLGGAHPISTYITQRRRHVRAMEPPERTSEVYLKNMSAAQQQFELLLDADAVTSTTWLDSLRRRHRIATGVDSGEGHVGSGAYRSNDDQFIHAGMTRDEVVEAGLAPEDRLDFQNSANSLIENELREWLYRTGQAIRGSVVEVRGIDEYVDELGPAKEPWHAKVVPVNRGLEHYFPHPRAVPAYRRLAGERVVEAWQAVKKASPGPGQDASAIRVALHTLADYYHTLINAHLFVRVNNSLAMTEVNSFLKRMGLNEVEHGHIDIFAFNLGYRDFRMYFEDFVKCGQRSILSYGVLSMEGRLIRLPFSQDGMGCAITR